MLITKTVYLQEMKKIEEKSWKVTFVTNITRLNIFSTYARSIQWIRITAHVIFFLKGRQEQHTVVEFLSSIFLREWQDTTLFE
jgi:hypothetical protein